MLAHKRSRVCCCMACSSPTLALCGGVYRAAVVPVAKGSYGEIFVADDIAAGRLVALTMQRATSAEAVREYRFFKAIRVAQASVRASNGSQYVVGLMDDFTDLYDCSWKFSYGAQPNYKKCSKTPLPSPTLFMVFDYLNSSVEQQFRLREGPVDVRIARSGWVKLRRDWHSFTRPT